MSLLWLVMALLVADGGDGLRFEGSVAAGGGYDTSLLVAPGSGAAGSTVATAGASGGAAVDLDDAASLYLGARLDGAAFPELDGLDRSGAGIEASLCWDVLDPVALVLTPSATWNWYSDPARNGASLSVRLTLRAKPLSWLVVRAGYGHQLATAADPVHGLDLDRVFGGSSSASAVAPGSRSPVPASAATRPSIANPPCRSAAGRRRAARRSVPPRT